MTFDQFKTLIYSATSSTEADFRIYPGPDLPHEDAGKCLVLTLVGGPGYQMEHMADVRNWQVRTIGEQNDYNSAEALAYLVDRAFEAREDRAHHVLMITRSGSPPTPLLVDDAERWHFVATYSSTVVS